MMEDPEICAETLESILPIKIGRIEHITTERTIDLAIDQKAVRLDVYAKDENNVYNIEMQSSQNKNLMKRARFYLSVIDLDSLEKGTDYEELPDSYVIFFCNFDILKKNKPFYKSRFMFEDAPEEELPFGSAVIFVNTNCTDFQGNTTLEAICKYIHGEETDELLIKKMAKRMNLIKSNPDWRRECMTIYYEKRKIHQEAFEQGIERGIEQGIEQGAEIKQLKIARKMLHKMSDEEISDYTELPIQRVAQLREEATTAQ